MRGGDFYPHRLIDQALEYINNKNRKDTHQNQHIILFIKCNGPVVILNIYVD